MLPVELTTKNKAANSAVERIEEATRVPWRWERDGRSVLANLFSSA